MSDLQEQIRHNETRLVKAKTERAKAEKDLAKSTKAIEANSAKAEELEAEIADLRMQLAATEQEAEPIRQTVEQAQAGVEDGREQLANLKAELDEQEDAIIEFKKAEVRCCAHPSLTVADAVPFPSSRPSSRARSRSRKSFFASRHASLSTGRPRLASFSFQTSKCECQTSLSSSTAKTDEAVRFPGSSRRRETMTRKSRSRREWKRSFVSLNPTRLRRSTSKSSRDKSRSSKVCLLPAGF